MRIAVIDDERPSRSEMIFLLQRLLPDAIIDEAASGTQAMLLIGKNNYDLLFVDIHLGDIEGIELMPIIRKSLPSAKIIFATAYADYAAHAFTLAVDDYILKPFALDRLEQVLRRCLPAAQSSEKISEKTPSKIAISKDKQLILLDTAQIVYIETDGRGRGCIIHTAEQSYTDNSYLADYEKKLQPFGFFRIHKSYLVQLALISSIFPWEGNSFSLKMKGFAQTVLPIGRDRYRELRQVLQL